MLTLKAEMGWWVERVAASAGKGKLGLIELESAGS